MVIFCFYCIVIFIYSFFFIFFTFFMFFMFFMFFTFFYVFLRFFCELISLSLFFIKIFIKKYGSLPLFEWLLQVFCKSLFLKKREREINSLKKRKKSTKNQQKINKKSTKNQQKIIIFSRFSFVW